MSREYYNSLEQNTFSEYRNFPAEQYSAPLEIPFVADEISKRGHEYVTDIKPTPKSGKKSSTFKKVLEAITKSASNVITSVVATVSTVAVAVVALTNLATSPPKFEFSDIKTGNDFIEYRLELSDVKEGVDYTVSVENPYHTFENQIKEGSTRQLITGLKPNLEYSLILKGIGDDGEGVVYHQSKLYTSNNKDPSGLFDVIKDGENKKITYSVYISDGYGLASNCFLSITQKGEEIHKNTDTDKGFFRGSLVYEQEEDIKISVYGEINGIATQIGEYLVYAEKEENPLPEAFNGEFNIESEKIKIFWNEDGYNRLQIPVNFVTADERVKYRLFIKAQNEVFEPSDKGEYLEFLLPDRINECFIEYKIFASDGEKEIIYKDSAFEEIINLAPSQIAITDVVLTGLNKFKVELDTLLSQADSFVESINLTVTTDNGDEITLTLNSIFEEAVFELPYGANQIFVNGELNTSGKYGDNPRVIKASEFVKNTEALFDGEITYYKSDGYLEIKIKGGYLPLDGRVKISDGNTEAEYGLYDYISFEVPNGNSAYTCYVVDGSGVAVTAEKAFEIDSSISADYTMNYINPHDVLTTYNSDGTMNFYMCVSFESQEDIYYEITLGENEIIYKSTDYVAVISNVPKGFYGVSYKVIKEIDGVRYVVYNVTPSGAVGEESSLETVVTGALNGKEGTLILEDYISYDLSSVKIISSNGETVVLSQDDFIKVENTYEAHFTLENEAELVTAYIGASFHMSMYEEIIKHVQIEGSLYVEYAVEIN